MPHLQVQIATPHPVMFLTDAESTTAPDIDGSQFATATKDCVAFFVLSHVDGATSVTITDKACDTGHKVFDGEIEASGGVLSLIDSETFCYLNVPVPLGKRRVEIWADDEENPDWVWVKLDAIRES